MSALAAVAVAWALGVSTPGSLPVETLQRTGPSEQRLDLVILGDGYRDVDQSKLTADAETLLEGLFGISPYRQYRGLMNVKLIHAESKDNGADNGSYGAVRDTAFGAYFNCSGVSYLLCVDYSAVLATAGVYVPEYDQAIVLVNDPMYGGSGGSVAVVSTHPNAVTTLRHELGHSLARLADEYEQTFPYPTCDATLDCFEPNATVRTGRSEVKWNAWIDPSTAVPTREGTGFAGIGLFEGCRYLTAGVYRPKDTGCLMKTNASVSFCSVCAEALVRAAWRYSNPIDRVAPSGAVTALACDALSFGVTTPPLEDASWSFVWTVDGAPVAGSGRILDLPPGTLAPGGHVVQVRVQDSTTLVRNDPTGLLQGVASWPVTVSPCSVCRAGLACGTSLCVDGMARPAPMCGSSGQCGAAGPSVSCGAYACDAEGLACRTTCSISADCAAGYECRSTQCVSLADGTPGPGGGGGGPIDAGSSRAVTPDAGWLADAGHSPVPLPPASCGCGAGGEGVAAALLWLAVAGARRRSRVGPAPLSPAPG
ncbi:MAG TPA: M64 family metallopeptidase [Myxococcales bacterium]|nr:M64 family metallopeptidase [Myxococcales bacterium]